MLVTNKVKDFFKQNMILLLIILISLVIRLIYTTTTRIPILVSDSPTYLDGAKYLFEHLYIDMYRPPVYLFGIIAASLIFGWGPQGLGIIFVQILFSILCIILAYDICRTLSSNRIFIYTTCFMTGASISIFGWDFIIMSENFSIFFLTLSVWLLIQFFKAKSYKYLTLLNIAVFLLFFTKPFYLVYPVMVFLIVLLRHLLVRDINIIKASKSFATGLLVIYVCAFGYSALNYMQNNYFGFSAVGNVNSFGKILQYHMEDFGDNDKLKKNIREAYSAASENELVDGDYLEPWKFIGKYGYWEENYREIGAFASHIMKQHPIKYIIESIKLLGKIFITLPPYKDYIAISAIQEPGMAAGFMEVLIGIYDKLDHLYFFIVFGIIEIFYALFFNTKALKGNVTYIVILVSVILYHYAVSIFLSYGDYCRLLAPSYIIMYILSNYYIYKSIELIVRLYKTRAITKFFLR